MAAAKEQGNPSKKRKRVASASKGAEGRGEKSFHPKKPKHFPPGTSKKLPQDKVAGKPPLKSKAPRPKGPKKPPLKSKPVKAFSVGDKSDGSAGNKSELLSKRDRRLLAKELAEARKKKRKPHYTLQQELALLWEKMRRRNIAKDERSKLVSEALRKMGGKMAEIATSHVSSRVLQTCIKYCSQVEKDAVFEELQSHFLVLSCNAYGVHLVKKMLDNASKKQLEGFISSLHGHVAPLLRHMVGSLVIEHAFQLGNASQKQRLLSELYSPELQLFKDLTVNNKGRLVDVISKLALQKSSVLHHMTSVIQPVLEKGILDHSIIHTTLLEYLTIADKSSATDVIQQLSSPLLVRMIHTRDGSRVGILCVKHGGAKERKKLIKGMKGHVAKIAQDQYGSLVLACILSAVDDTKLLTKIIIRELQTILKQLVLDKNGRRPILQLLHPQCPRYLSPDDLAALSLLVPSLSSKGEASGSAGESSGMQTSTLETPKCDYGTSDDDTARENIEEGPSRDKGTDKDASSENNLHLVEGGKKDHALRRYELLVESGLAESLIETCIGNACELLQSNFGREVIYEVVTGGTGLLLRQNFSDKLDYLHEAIASLGALPRLEESEEEHIFENFYSSRTIRKLVLDCPAFAVTLWKAALKDKAEMWAQGHSSKVVSAFLESSDAEVRDLAKTELQGLIDSGALKVAEARQLKKED